MTDDLQSMRGWMSSDAEPTPAESRRYTGWIFAILGYGLAFAIACSTLAFVSPEARREWAPLVVGLLFPIGEGAFTASQVVGGFLQMLVGPALTNLGASLPLFGAAFSIGVMHATIAVLVGFGLRALLTRWRGSEGK